LDQANHCRVEVSGWDTAEDFFVETTTLTWGSDNVREIEIHSVVKESGLVFVRLLQPRLNESDFPVPCRVKGVMTDVGSGLTHVQLVQLRPRCRGEGEAERPHDSTVLVV
jgi:hypothetical protein